MNIKKKLTCVLLFISLGLSMYPQTIEIQCSFPLVERNEFRWYVQPLENTSQNAGVELQKDEKGVFRADIKAASDGFYKLYGTNQKMQMMFSFYLPGEGKQQMLEFQSADNALSLNLNEDNRALSAYNAFMHKVGRTLWTEGRTMEVEQLKKLLKSYDAEVTRLLKTYSCSEPVSKYLRLWAYTSAYSDSQRLDFIVQKSKEEINFTAKDFLDAPEKMLDKPMAKYFYPTNQIIMSTIPNGTLDSKLSYLRNAYQCESVRQDVEDSILLLYLSNFNYSDNFESGLKELENISVKYHLSDVYLNKFKMRRFAIKGASFPDGIVLQDVNGNEVSFDEFKGFYVYVDMWASWCGPCCRQVPYLQELEKTLQNPMVKFVSISTDTKPEAWKKKMATLNMKGNQFIDQKRKLGEALNITGIPHFLIYDKEGKLLFYHAPRPSEGKVLKNILENLK